MKRLARAGLLQSGFRYTINFPPSDPPWVKALIVENWCEENCKGDFWVCPETVYFYDSNDAMFFKLVYGGAR